MDGVLLHQRCEGPWYDQAAPNRGPPDLVDF